MEPLTEALRLLRRHSELQEAMRRHGGIDLTEEKEIYELRETLKSFPAAVRTILEASNRLHRPIEALTTRDITSADA
jgi:hypothetical protein